MSAKEASALIVPPADVSRMSGGCSVDVSRTSHRDLTRGTGARLSMRATLLGSLRPWAFTFSSRADNGRMHNTLNSLRMPLSSPPFRRVVAPIVLAVFRPRPLVSTHSPRAGDRRYPLRMSGTLREPGWGETVYLTSGVRICSRYMQIGDDKSTLAQACVFVIRPLRRTECTSGQVRHLCVARRRA